MSTSESTRLTKNEATEATWSTGLPAACRFYRAPAAIYAGYSDLVRFHGVRLPERLKPAPLNLCVRSFRPGVIDETQFVMQRFELLDLDAF